jgi:hypothetical protein
MKFRFRSRLITLGLIAIGVVAAPFLISIEQQIYWVGHTDLEIECIVTDALTGDPIKGALIHVRSEGGLCAEREEQQFELKTDANGSVKRLIKDCMCFGTRGRNIDTYFVHLPWWFYQVRANSYHPSEWTELNIPQNVRQVQRGKPAATLVVPIQLQRKNGDLVENKKSIRGRSDRTRMLAKPP